MIARAKELRMRAWFDVAVLGALVLSGCKREDAATAAEPPAASASAPDSALAVRFARIEVRRVAPVLELTGTLDPRERSEVAAQTAGVVRKINVDVGSRVKKGDVLAVLDTSEAQLRFAAAEAAAEQQRARLGLKSGEAFDASRVADVRSAKEASELRAKEAERARALAKSGAISTATLDQATSAAEQAAAQLDAARNAAEQAWAGLNAAKAQARLSRKALGDTRVLAPFDGAVIQRRISTGEYAALGRVVAVLVDDNPLRLRLDVPEADSASVGPGKEVLLRVAAYPERDFRGVITRVGASLDAASRTLPVEADIRNDERMLHPGFFASARIALEGDDVSALFVPKSALGRAGNSSRVFVRAGNRVVEKLVVAGRQTGDSVEVRGPLSETDEVAIDNVDRLSDSQAVAAR
jgi:multidrug efflux pump subunit AcrA (membrane-fusion protein)